jgi:hypothetical protein
MSRDLNPMSTFELDCPTCAAPMEVIDRFTLWGVPSDVEHVKVRCVVGHWFTLPTDSLAQPPVRARRPVTVADTSPIDDATVAGVGSTRYSFGAGGSARPLGGQQ